MASYVILNIDIKTVLLIMITQMLTDFPDMVSVSKDRSPLGYSN